LSARVACLFGTRPEAIKMAPLVKEFQSRRSFEPMVIVTAQHRELLDQVLAHFHIQPHHDLDIMSRNQSLTDTTVRVLSGLMPLLESERPDLVLVHGDTTTTLASSLAAAYQRIPVAHVEAGLRTRRKYDPFPEEINRLLSDHIADLHFAPTSWARENLLAEGIPPDNIYVTGNTAIDALVQTTSRPHRFSLPALIDLEQCGARFMVVDVHRRENFGAPMEAVCRGLRDVALANPGVVIVVSVHPNPNVKRVVDEQLSDMPNVMLLEPLPYPDWAHLMKRARLIATDSGGLQEEAPALGVPVLLFRRVTERPEAVRAGTVRVVGVDREDVRDMCSRLLHDEQLHRQMAQAPNPYGDGRAACRIADATEYHLGFRQDRPQDFLCSSGR